jgi:hypothetical protein
MINYLAETSEATVGGLLLLAELSHGQVTALSFNQETNAQHRNVQIQSEAGRFVVTNRFGKRITLRWPGEIVKDPPRRPLVVDDLPQLHG